MTDQELLDIIFAAMKDKAVLGKDRFIRKNIRNSDLWLYASAVSAWFDVTDVDPKVDRGVTRLVWGTELAQACRQDYPRALAAMMSIEALSDE